MEFFSKAIDVLQLCVIGFGVGVGIWGLVNLFEAYANDNPGAKAQGVKQLIGGGGIALVGIMLVPLLKNVFTV